MQKKKAFTQAYPDASFKVGDGALKVKKSKKSKKNQKNLEKWGGGGIFAQLITNLLTN